ncbi:MAG TPA: substrate-binding domain-containing protein [Fimbriiglobus sp.]|jgi:ribose transport system substrate-binding protein
MRAWALRIGFVSLLAVSLAGIPACGNKGGGDKPKVAVVTNCTAEFWSICEAGAKKAAAENGVEVIFRQPKSNTVTDQMEIVETVQKLGVKGLAVSVINPKEQSPDLSRIAKEVNLITMDNDAKDCGRLCYVGIDNYLAGEAVGRMVKKALPAGGTVAIFIGNTTSANSKDRVAGVLDELAGTSHRKEIWDGKFEEKYGNYALFRKSPVEDETKEDVAQNNAKDVLEQLKNTPNVCMVGLYAYNPKAILEAARSKELVNKIKIVGFDEDWVTLDGIAKGEIEGTVVQDPFNYGYEAVKLLAMLAKGGDKSKLPTSPTPYSIVVKDAKAGETEQADGLTIHKYSATAYVTRVKEALNSVKAEN